MALRVGLKTLAGFSHQMGTMLEAGLPIRRALEVQERKARGAWLGHIRTIGAELENGLSFSEALGRRGRAFPVLFKRLVKVGEDVGGLDIVFRKLGEYYDFIRSMWRRFFVQLIYPIFQYFALILILAGVRYLMLMLVESDPNPGWPAVRILLIGLAIFLAPFVLYFAATRFLGGRRVVHEFLIRMPVLGAMCRTLAIARFSYCMEMMTDAGVHILDAVQSSLEATANHAFIARGPRIRENLQGGMTLFQSLDATGLFPYDYIQMLNTAEESGSMPDIFRRLAKYYFEKAETAIKAFGTVVSVLLAGTVAAVIIYYIFFFFGSYMQLIGDLTGGGP